MQPEARHQKVLLQGGRHRDLAYQHYGQQGTTDTLKRIFEKNVVQDLTKYTGTASFGTGCDLKILP